MIPVPLFESVTISFRFQAFTLKRFMSLSNHAVLKSSSFDAGYKNVLV